jgi:hypothetical protein
MDPLLVLFGFGVGLLVGTTGMRPALGIVALTSGLTLLSKAGADVPTAVIIATPFVLGAAAALVLRGRETRRSAALAIRTGS